MLRSSRVVFDESRHSYTLDGLPLNGITRMLSMHVFPDKYRDIPEHILKKAAERGSAIHADCHAGDVMGNYSTKEGFNYFLLKDEKGITTLANEYIPRSTVNLDTKEMTNYLNRIQQFANVDLGIVLPNPEDLIWEEFYNHYKDFI